MRITKVSLLVSLCCILLFGTNILTFILAYSRGRFDHQWEILNFNLALHTLLVNEIETKNFDRASVNTKVLLFQDLKFYTYLRESFWGKYKETSPHLNQNIEDARKILGDFDINKKQNGLRIVPLTSGPEVPPQSQ